MFYTIFDEKKMRGHPSVRTIYRVNVIPVTWLHKVDIKRCAPRSARQHTTVWDFVRKLRKEIGNTRVGRGVEK